MYWTFAQQLAHLTVNGATDRRRRPVRLGTRQRPDEGRAGQPHRADLAGAEPLTLADGSTRTFLEDGDTVTLRGWCGGEATVRASASARRAARLSLHRNGCPTEVHDAVLPHGR